jgi:glycosyltransferase involved in cell wall biosynthesis
VPYLFPKAGRVRRAAIRHLAASADLAVATNAEDAATVGAWLAPDRLALVPIGSNVPDAVPPGYDRSEWRRANGLTPTADVLVYFGFLNESKGARSIVGALDRLVSQGRDARLVMLGGRLGASDATNAEYLSRFETDLERHGLAVRVLWTGHVPSAEVSAWFHAADVAVLPYEDGASFRRGSLLAALAHGAPVVTTIPSTTPDALVHPALAERPPELEDHRSALLVPPGDVAALARAIAEVLDDPALAAALAKAARATAAGFGWEAIAGRHVELYRRMLERRARA